MCGRSTRKQPKAVPAITSASMNMLKWGFVPS